MGQTQGELHQLTLQYSEWSHRPRKKGFGFYGFLLKEAQGEKLCCTQDPAKRQEVVPDEREITQIHVSTEGKGSRKFAFWMDQKKKRKKTCERNLKGQVCPV